MSHKLNDLKAVLEPVYILTKCLQAEQYTAGDFLIDRWGCESALNRIIRCDESYGAAAKEMTETLRNRTSELVSSLQLGAAVYMDPRFTHNGPHRMW